MPFTTQQFTYAGGAQTFVLSLGLGYDEESDITAHVVDDLDGNGDQIFRAITFDSEFVVRLTADLNVNDEVVISRTVSQSTQKVNFETGGAVTPRNLQLQYRHILSLQQELLDGRVGLLNPAVDAAAAAVSAAAAAVSAAAAEQSAQEADTELSVDLTPVLGGNLLDGGFTIEGRDVNADGIKLDAIENAATADQSDAEIETAYNSQVAAMSQGTAEAGTSTTVERITAERIKQAITALGSGGISDKQTFTASDTWTKPTSPAPGADAMVLIECWGGGGSGKNISGIFGGGGGGGGYFSFWLPASDLGATENVTVGAGGAAQASSNNDGNDGGDTTFGTGTVIAGAQGGDGGNGTTGGLGGHGTPPGGGLTTDSANSPFAGGVAPDSVAGGNGVFGGAGGGDRAAKGGDSMYGGGGGGGADDGATGVSQYSGDGSAGNGSGATSAGADPGGGSGASGNNAGSGKGGDGQIVITIYE